MIEHSDVYFIDHYNFGNLCSRAKRGDTLARELLHSILIFMEQAPEPICSLCDKCVPESEIPSMVIVVIWTSEDTEKSTLTSWICPSCGVTCDNDKFKQMMHSRHTVH